MTRVDAFPTLGCSSAHRVVRYGPRTSGDCGGTGGGVRGIVPMTRSGSVVETNLTCSGGSLDELEQRVEALVRITGLVDDEDLRRSRTGAKVARSRIRASTPPCEAVDLDDVERTGAAGGQLFAAGSAPTTGVQIRRTVRSAPGCARTLSRRIRALRTGTRKSHAIRAQRRLERLRHVLLPDHLVEGVGAIPAIQCCGSPSKPSWSHPHLRPAPRSTASSRWFRQHDRRVSLTRPGLGCGGRGRHLLGGVTVGSKVTVKGVTCVGLAPLPCSGRALPCGVCARLRLGSRSRCRWPVRRRGR